LNLTPLQRDALVELLNIGFGRAGASLSRLTDQRVILSVPEICVQPIEGLRTHLRSLVKDRVASVHQSFSGAVGGDALLILEPSAASALKELLTGDAAPKLTLDPPTREVLTEVGNILLAACLGTLGNLLQVRVAFRVPSVDIASLRAVVTRLLASDADAARHALVVTAGFQLPRVAVTGYIVVVLTSESMERLLVGVDEWDAQQGGSATPSPGT
jgi:chemotaxis protein CheC